MKRRAHSSALRSLASAAACALTLPGLSACTLLDEPFAPQLLSSVVGADAGAPAVVERDAAAPGPGEPLPSRCTVEGSSSPILNGDEPGCTNSIGLIAEPGEPEVVDAGSSAAPQQPSLPQLEPLSLPPCEGALGAFGAVERITGIDFDENVFGPALSPDGRTLFFSAYTAGQQQIYTATRSKRGAAFSDVVELSAVNSLGTEGSPFLASSEQRLYFFSDREGGTGNRDIWLSERSTPGGEFAEPVLLAGVNTGSSELLPWLSADELEMWFISSRPGGAGGADVWHSTRTSIDTAFAEPANVVELGSTENEGRVVLSADGLTAFFSSDRSGGSGLSDLWTARRASTGAPFSTPTNLATLNSATPEVDVMLSSDETELFFASARTGVSTLWLATRSCSE